VFGGTLADRAGAGLGLGDAPAGPVVGGACVLLGLPEDRLGVIAGLLPDQPGIRLGLLERGAGPLGEFVPLGQRRGC